MSTKDKLPTACSICDRPMKNTAFPLWARWASQKVNPWKAMCTPCQDSYASVAGGILALGIFDERT